MNEPPDPRWAEPIYLDASALVKLFVPEPESDALNQELVGAEDVVVSDLALTEMASALGRRTRAGNLTLTESRRHYREAEKLATACRRVELTPPIHRRAERLLLSSLEIPLRALDALHVAAAVDAGAATLVTYDPRLRKAASSQGLIVVPESPPPDPERSDDSFSEQAPAQESADRLGGESDREIDENPKRGASSSSSRDRSGS